MIDVLALDLATVCGYARGPVGGRPLAGSVNFATHRDASDNAIFARALVWLSEILEPRPRPDVVIVEQMLPPGARVGTTSRAVRDRLAGLHGIARAVAFLRGIYMIQSATVGDVRGHFIGERGLRSQRAKAEVMAQCARMGWLVPDHNAADAAALWSYACGLIDPKTSLEVSPLFQRAGVRL